MRGEVVAVGVDQPHVLRWDGLPDGVKPFFRRVVDAGDADRSNLVRTVELKDRRTEPFLETTYAQAAGRANVVAQVGAPSTRAAVANARHAEQCGADALMVATPYYEPLDLDGAFRYLEQVAESTSLPLCVYNHPPAMG